VQPRVLRKLGEGNVHVPYVIIGAGTTANAAIESILQKDAKAEIVLLSDPEDLPKGAKVRAIYVHANIFVCMRARRSVYCMVIRV
jgi:FlaA1/EpsC-like NDP-sugar epimerase